MLDIPRCSNCGSFDFVEDTTTQIVSCWRCGTPYKPTPTSEIQELVDESR